MRCILMRGTASRRWASEPKAGATDYRLEKRVVGADHFPLATALLLSTRASLGEMVRAGLNKRTLDVFRESTQLFPALLRIPNPASCLLFIDLATVPDAERVISFVKASSTVNQMPIVTLGTADDYDVFDQRALAAVNGVIELPCGPTDIATVVEPLTQASPPPPNVRWDKRPPP